MNLENCLRKIELRYLLFFALLFRVIGHFILKDSALPDSITYFTSGQDFFEKGVISSRFTMPLYPIVYYVSKTFFLGSLDILFSTWIVYLVYKLSLELFKSDRIAKTSALLASIYPFLIYYSAVGLTESFYVFLVLFAFYFYYKGYFIRAHILTVLSIMTRPSLDPLAPILIVFFLFFIHKKKIKFIFKHLIFYSIVYLTFFTPWWIHNFYKYDSFVRLNLADGVVWYSGHNPMNKSGGGLIVNDETPQGYADVDLNEFRDRNRHLLSDLVAYNNQLKKEAFAFIKENPRHAIKMSWVKFKRFWAVVPNHPKFRSWYYVLVCVISLIPLYIGTLSFLVFGKKQNYIDASPILLFMFYLMSVHTLLISSFRYRFPVEPFMILLLPVGIKWLFEALKRIKSPKIKPNA